jgi:hypothetical protein
MLTDFIELSVILTGYEKLNPRIAQLYYDKLSNVFGEHFSKILETYHEAVKINVNDPELVVRTKIWSDHDMQVLSQEIIKLWYTARLTTTNFVTAPVNWVAPQEAYFESLLWKTIEAHPPALSGGYFGYWRYAPEN